MAMMRLQRIRPWLVAVALAALALPARAADVDPFLPNDSEVVVNLNVRQLLEAPLVQKYAAARLKAKLNDDSTAREILEALGFDPLKDLTSITIAGPDLGKSDRGIVIVHGRFNLAKFQAKAEEASRTQSELLQVHRAGDYVIYETRALREVFPGQEKPMFVGLVNSTTVVASQNQDYVLDALRKEKGTQTSALNKDLKGLVEKTDATQSLWLVALSSALGKASTDSAVQDLIGSFDNMTSGLTVGGDVKAQVVFAGKNANAAAELSNQIREGVDQAKLLVGFFIEKNKQFAPAAEALEGIKVTTEGSTVSVKGVVGSAAIDKALSKGGR